MMGFMMLFWLLVLAGIVWLVYRAGAGGRGGWPAPPRQSAEEILGMRYARGEIDEETYQRMLAELREASSTRTSGGRSSTAA